MYENLEAVLDEYVRPLLRGHGGDMEVIEVKDGILRFKMKGQCAGCPAADLTTETLIQEEVVGRVPGIERVVLVNEVSEDLLAQARALLRRKHES